MFRRTLGPKQLALMWLQYTLQHFAALRSLWIGDAKAFHRKTNFGVPFGVAIADTQSGLRDESHSAPFKIRSYLKHLGHRLERASISFPRDHSLVLIFNAILVFLQLPQQHHDRLQQVEGLESGNYDRFAFIACDPFIRAAANDRGNVSWADESIDPHI